MCPMKYPTLGDFIGNTPLIQLRGLPGIGANTLLAKLEGNNPAGSVKDRPAYSMIRRAQERGEIKPGDTLIEATSGNTGIALAMAASVMGYRLILIMPEHLSIERRAVMKAFGAELLLVTQQQGMEYARDLALKMQAEGQGRVLDQFANPDNPRAHYEGTAPEIWRDTGGKITHFVSSMGTTGTIMGCSRYFKEKNPDIRIVGVQPDGESSIPGIRKWPEAYLPRIFERPRVDRVIEVAARAAEDTMRLVARTDGLFCGPSSGGALWSALQLCRETTGATIVTIVCDRGDRYISTGVFPA
jgi:S-sulfo-L-cysteine synthase (O-acetyl-L-serine-dependent)